MYTTLLPTYLFSFCFPIFFDSLLIAFGAQRKKKTVRVCAAEERKGFFSSNTLFFSVLWFNGKRWFIIFIILQWLMNAMRWDRTFTDTSDNDAFIYMYIYISQAFDFIEILLVRSMMCVCAVPEEDFSTIQINFWTCFIDHCIVLVFLSFFVSLI